MRSPGFLSRLIPTVFSAGSGRGDGRDASSFRGTVAGERRSVGGIPFRWCPATDPKGFLMGSPAGEPGREDNELQHCVVLTQGFWLAETPLTQGQWQGLVGTGLQEQAKKALADDAVYDLAGNGKLQTVRDYLGMGREDAARIVGTEDAERPIYWVNWHECADYCIRMTERERGRGNLPEGWKFCLPTEAQWEWACRAGTTTATYAGEMELAGPKNAPVLDGIAWYAGNKDEGKPGPMTVGLKQENGWGLRDTLGNVWEWCADWHGAYPSSPVQDPEGPMTGERRVLRGGSRYSKPPICRAAHRSWGSPVLRNGPQGLRPAVVSVGGAR